MKKSIYKITNLINQKAYIGQTNNVQRRFREHKNMSVSQDEENTKILYNAFKKYGIDNFLFEVIEEDIEDYNNREKYWIAFFHTYINDPEGWGYNMTPGGEEPPVFRGEEHPLATHSQQEVDIIINLIKNTKLSFLQIAKQCNYDRSSIERINRGELWFNKELSYPLRKESTKDFLKQRAQSIIQDLQNDTLTQAEIAKKYGVGRTMITAINNGQNYYNPDLKYPIRAKPVNKPDKSIIMCDQDSLIELKEFSNSVEAATFLNKTKSSASNIRLAAHNYPKKNAYGYKWKFKIK